MGCAIDQTYAGEDTKLSGRTVRCLPQELSVRQSLHRTETTRLSCKVRVGSISKMRGPAGTNCKSGNVNDVA